jgi:ribosomal protein L32E
MIMARKKIHPKFNVPNYGAKSRSRVIDRWRAQRGIDNKKRIKRKGYGAVPGIGYKNSDDARFRRPDGMMERLVHNEAEMLSLAGSKDIAARLYGSLSIRKKAMLQKIADEKKIKVVNRVKESASKVEQVKK